VLKFIRKFIEKLETVDPHVELEHLLDMLVVAPVPLQIVTGGALDDADAELPQDLDAPPGAPVDRALHQWHEDQLRHEQHERRCGHPEIDMDHVGQHGQEDAALQQRLGNAAADKTADRFDLRDDHRRLDPFRLRRGCGWRNSSGEVIVSVRMKNAERRADRPGGCARSSAWQARFLLRGSPRAG
jgi:hypothetical protein